MERYLIQAPLSWRERTLSAMAQRREEENRKRLEGAALFGSVFGRGSGASWAEPYRASYLAQEGKTQPQADSVRRAIRTGLTKELPLITVREEMLLQRTIIFGGMTPLFDPEEYGPAVSLVRRLWCTVEFSGEETVLLKLSEALAPRMVEVMQSPDYQKKRPQVFTLSATLHSLLYLNGFVYADTAVSRFQQDRLRSASARERVYLYRFLQAEFDYLWNGQGDMILLHQGLADPSEILRSGFSTVYQEPRFTRQMILDGMQELLREEEPAVEALKRELGDALQPEYQADTVVEDLKLLVKQGAGVQELMDVLSPCLATATRPALRAAVRRLAAETIPWAGIRHGVLN